MHGIRFYAREYKQNMNQKRCSWVARYHHRGEDHFGITEKFICVAQRDAVTPMVIITPLSWKKGKCERHPTYRNTWICKPKQLQTKSRGQVTIPVTNLRYPCLVVSFADECIDGEPITHIVEYIYRMFINKSNM